MRVWAMVLAAVTLAGCGVPKEAGRFAGQEIALLAATPADGMDDDAVRQALISQVDAWDEMVGLLDRREFLGTPVGEDFTALVHEAAALARREKVLMEDHEDVPELNREVLAHMQAMWGKVKAYLGE